MKRAILDIIFLFFSDGETNIMGFIISKWQIRDLNTCHLTECTVPLSPHCLAKCWAMSQCPRFKAKLYRCDYILLNGEGFSVAPIRKCVILPMVPFECSITRFANA